MRRVLCIVGTFMLWVAGCVFVLAFTWFQFGGGHQAIAGALPEIGQFWIYMLGFGGSAALAAVPAGLCVTLTRAYC